MDAAGQRPGDVAMLLARIQPRAGSLIITVFGDSVVPRGGSIWMGSLIRLMAPFGISERLVRTGVYRLARQGWLAARSRGRKAYYHLTPSGIAIFAEAERAIYAAEPPDWDGQWTLLQVQPAPSSTGRRVLRSQLAWSGYGQLSPQVFIHTGRRQPPEFAGADEAAVFHANLAEIDLGAGPREVAARAWDLDGLNAAYADFNAIFAGFTQASRSDEDAFALLTLMIHEYRRILLRDPQLPQALLPSTWAGHEARSLAASLYRRHAAGAGRFVAARMESWNGLAPAPAASYFDRFKSAAATPRRENGTT